MKKVIRSLCYFAKSPNESILERLDVLEKKLKTAGFVIQTKRLCVSDQSIRVLNSLVKDENILLSIGSVDEVALEKQFDEFIDIDRCSLNLDLTNSDIGLNQVEYLLRIIKRKASKTFNFAYTFNNSPSSPYFPSAVYEKDGFSIGLQPTDLAVGCTTLEEWLERMKTVWQEIYDLFADEEDFLGIDSSIAPLFEGDSSLVEFVRRIYGSFDASVLTDSYLKMTKFIKDENPKPIGLCGLMLPCLEDFELAKEYDDERFSIERNLFLSLHSGLGIDTYPIGIDESPERILNILKVVQGLSNKHKKALSVRFVSDGKSRIGEKTDFQNQYLKDVLIRPL
ncbi:MAG: DUF711 family protein [Patescibacteria group bacterium]|nr:DUF711 family protein [Patescibacteria group bacterium]